MRLLFIFIRKEFSHVFRDRKVLLILFGMPVVQVMLFGFALSNEIKNTEIAVVDHSKDIHSQQLIAKINASNYFNAAYNITTASQLPDAFSNGKIRAALVIEEGFGRDLVSKNSGRLQIIADATDINNANQVIAYLNAIIKDYRQGISGDSIPYKVQPEMVMLFNPQLKGAANFVPGVMAMVLMLVCVMMTAISIVKEKETGTMEVLLVSPMKPAMVVFSKAVPYFILSFINLIAILLLSIYILDVPVRGSIFLLLLESTLFIITCLNLGIVISNRAKTQEVAMLISLVGMMMPTVLLSGFMFPVESMPVPLQSVSNVLPSKWYYIIVKAIMVKGAGFDAVWKETLILLATMLVLFGISLKTFKMRLQ